MFGPVRGPWPDDTWKGWWGDDPPFHTPVFVLTNHARGSLTMEVGTTFPFVTNGIQDALTRAREAAEGKDTRLGGGVATIREYLRAGHLDEMHLAYAPVLLGSGECLLTGMDLPGPRISGLRTASALARNNPGLLAKSDPRRAPNAGG